MKFRLMKTGVGFILLWLAISKFQQRVASSDIIHLTFFETITPVSINLSLPDINVK